MELYLYCPVCLHGVYRDNFTVTFTLKYLLRLTVLIYRGSSHTDFTAECSPLAAKPQPSAYSNPSFRLPSSTTEFTSVTQNTIKTFLRPFTAGVENIVLQLRSMLHLLRVASRGLIPERCYKKQEVKSNVLFPTTLISRWLHSAVNNGSKNTSESTQLVQLSAHP